MAPSAALTLAALRERIDEVDRRLVELLNARSELVVEVGKVKRATGTPIYAPHREAEVLARVLSMNNGPLPGRTIEGIYRELMSGSFALEKPLTIGFLGPKGSFSHMAAVKHFGSSVGFEDLREIAGVFTEVQRGHVDYGLVPIENSIMGGIVETLDAFAKRAMPGDGGSGAGASRPAPRGVKSGPQGIHICAEVQLEVHHALLGACEPSKIRRIASKPEVFSQCRVWLATQYPQAELVPVASSSRAVQMVREAAERGTLEQEGLAAIGSQLAAELYDVSVLFDGIEDDPNNITRFFVLGRHEAGRTGHDKTSIMFSTLNKPGALVRVLTDFQEAGVNLTHIDKRPSGRNNWSYTFFIDAEGHQSDAPVAAAITKARRHCRELIVLGSYPRSQRILG
ncbi:MAG: chorismate mutase [Planctomycetaceae bacterium]|nr:chorismate mutase [Planctomycetaceae bacterium]